MTPGGSPPPRSPEGMRVGQMLPAPPSLYAVRAASATGGIQNRRKSPRARARAAAGPSLPEVPGPCLNFALNPFNGAICNGGRSGIPAARRKRLWNAG